MTPSGAGPSNELPGGDLPPRGRARANRPGEEGSASVTVRSGPPTQTWQNQTIPKKHPVIFSNLPLKFHLSRHLIDFSCWTLAEKLCCDRLFQKHLIRSRKPCIGHLMLCLIPPHVWRQKQGGLSQWGCCDWPGSGLPSLCEVTGCWLWRNLLFCCCDLWLRLTVCLFLILKAECHLQQVRWGPAVGEHGAVTYVR